MHRAPSDDDLRWKEFRLTVLLKELHEYADKVYKGDAVEYEGYKPAKDRAIALRRSLATSAPGSIVANASSSNTFFKDVTGNLADFLSGFKLIGRFKDGSEVSRKMKSVLSRNGRVEGALKAWEAGFRLLLPDLVGMDEKRWPGHVSYRAGLSHYVAVCLRVHSILPEVSFDAITLASARRILVPALAHNFKFFAKDHPELYHLFVHDKALRSKGFFSLSQESGANLPGPSRPVFRKWLRLFKACHHFGEKWGEARMLELCAEFQDLLQDYETDPRNSRLWRDLSILAAGDMAVDEILVSWVIKDVGGDEASLSSSPLVNCARSRFSLLRYAYMMVKEAEIFQADFEMGLSEAGKLLAKIEESEDRTLAGEFVDQAFGWAYLLSRNNLLGRKALSGDLSMRNPDDAGMMLYELLNKLRFKAKSEEHRTLALRYLIGYMTNPRFIKPYAKIRLDPKNRKSVFTSATTDDLIAHAGKMVMMPKSIVLMAKGRIALHYAYFDQPNSAMHLQSCLGHYAAIIKAMDAPSHGGIMDGEVIAWAFPEIYLAIEKLTTHDTESSAEWEEVKESLQVLGETQFGVFFNPKEEVARIKVGLEKAVGL
ncbi:MAG: hypothetical protein WCP67_08820 [Verrucomicrobiota bacterium]|jgi:hypothetical protein